MDRYGQFPRIPEADVEASRHANAAHILLLDKETDLTVAKGLKSLFYTLCYYSATEFVDGHSIEYVTGFIRCMGKSVATSGHKGGSEENMLPTPNSFLDLVFDVQGNCIIYN